MMYKPGFNTVLVEIDSEVDKWGKGNDESMLGQSYREGTVISIGMLAPTQNHPTILDDTADSGLLRDTLMETLDKRIMWNEGAEAGTVFEHDGKTYGFIYWSDIRGIAA